MVVVGRYDGDEMGEGENAGGRFLIFEWDGKYDRDEMGEKGDILFFNKKMIHYLLFNNLFTTLD